MGNGAKAFLLILLILVAAVGGWYLMDSDVLERENKSSDKKDGDGTDNEIPIASFTTSMVEAKVGENITFNADSSSDNDGEVVRFHFDFGDSQTMDFTRESREAEGIMEMIAWHNYTIANTYTVTLEVFDDAEPPGKSEVESVSIKILPDDYQASNTYFLSARAIDTEEANFTLENDAIMCEVNVSFDARFGFTEPSSASVWLENPYGDVIMNETVSLGAGESASYGITFTPDQLSTIGQYNLILQCTEGRVQYSYDIIVDY